MDSSQFYNFSTFWTKFLFTFFFFFTVDLKKKTFKFFKYFITLVYYEWPQGKVFGVFAELAPRPHV